MKIAPVLKLALVAGALAVPASAVAQQPAPRPATQAPSTPAPPAAQTPPAAQAPRPLPSINGTQITEAEVAAAQAELSEALAQVPEEQRRQQLVDYLVTVRVLAAQARQEQMQDTPEMRARLSFVTDRVLMETLLRREIDRLVTPAAVQAFYDERVRSVTPETEVRARHILVATEDEAKAIIAELSRGGNFEQLARERSTDPGSKEEGGDLGFFTRERMVGPFAEAAFAMQPGQTSQAPVQTQFGWHVIRVEERRQQALPTLQEIEPQIRNFLSRRAQGEVIARLRQGARIEGQP
jgi:peptidyl-prolyl cis-trans isomerase C